MPRNASLSESYSLIAVDFPPALHWENYASIPFHIELDMILVTVFL